MKEEIIISSNVLEELKAYLHKNKFTKIAILVDENTKEHCYPIIADGLGDHIEIEIKSGEENKNIETCNYIWENLTKANFNRSKSALINLGGGVIGDMGGFCAATFKRGIPFINIPTTLLAQVDATIGGKLGIDFKGMKNHIGLFKDPNLIIIDDQFLKTLPNRELKSGFAEIIKHTLIHDSEGFKYLEETEFSDLDWKSLIQRSIETKSEIVIQDPQERGLRKILNFGHTIGHAIESISMEGNQRLLHGEAIALGMMVETYLSTIYSNLDKEEATRIYNYFKKNYNSEKPDIQKVVFNSYLSQDKKNSGEDSLISFSLLRKIGEATFDVQLDKDDIWKHFEEIWN